MILDVNKIREDFHIFESKPELSYLDNAATTQTPNKVMRAMSEYYLLHRANIHRGIYPLSEEASNLYEEARGKVASFVGAERKEIIFTGGATSSANMLIRSLEDTYKFNKGDEIVVSIMEHHSVLLPLQELAKRSNCTLKFIPLRSDFTLDIEKALKLISKKTKIVAVILASNVTGEINKLESIIEKAEEVGAHTIVDAAQAVGHIEVDVKKLDCDFLFFSGHKMCGPTGIGVLYGKKELLEKLNPSHFGGGAVEEVTKADSTLKESPYKFEAGTPAIAGAIGLGASVDYLKIYGMKDTHAYIKELYKNTLEKLREIDGLIVYSSDSENNSGIISFTLEGIHPHDIAEILSRQNVAVRAGHHCAMPFMEALGAKSTVRVSFYLYNTPYDVDVLIDGINEVKKVFA